MAVGRMATPKTGNSSSSPATASVPYGSAEFKLQFVVISSRNAYETLR
jgi:hypothetical protein